MTTEELAILRRAYARQVLAAAGVADPALERALAETERERYLGPGPWQVLRAGDRYAATPDADPLYLYTDDLVAIDAARRLNNGQPSFLAKLIHAAAIRPGDHVVHVGTGTGYYTAVMARLAGPDGRVTGLEVDPGLAARAAANLAGLPGATVLAGDGARVDVAPADVVFVNAGAVRPADLWLDRLEDGGRLVLPLTVDAGGQGATRGAVFLVTRRGDGLRGAPRVADGDLPLRRPARPRRRSAPRRGLRAARRPGCHAPASPGAAARGTGLARRRRLVPDDVTGDVGLSGVRPAPGSSGAGPSGSRRACRCRGTPASTAPRSRAPAPRGASASPGPRPAWRRRACGCAAGRG